MATYHAIAATGQTIVGLLKDASAQTEFADAQFELYQAGDFQSTTPIAEGISIYLYRVAINTARRNMPPTTGHDGRRFRPPLPVDLFFLLTPWGKSAAKQQRILGWAMRTLQDVPVLPASLLNYYVPESNTFRPDETIELICDPVPLQDMTSILDPIKTAQQISVTYVARLVLIESAVEIEEGPPVQTRQFDYGRGDRN